MDKDRIAMHKKRVQEFNIQMGKYEKERKWMIERMPIVLRKKEKPSKIYFRCNEVY